eukprot:14188843-Ditylum_brightwellii.AAC.1
MDVEEDEEATMEMEICDDKNLLSTNFIHVKKKNEPKKTQFKVQKIDPATGRQHTVVSTLLVLLDHFPLLQ